MMNNFLQKGSAFCAAALLVAACGSNPTLDMSPSEIGEYLGYSGVVSVAEIPEPNIFDLEAVNSRAAVMKAQFGREYLIMFAHGCPEAGFGGAMKTTSTGGRLDTQDSIVINDTYCRISEIFTVQ